MNLFVDSKWQIIFAFSCLIFLCPIPLEYRLWSTYQFQLLSVILLCNFFYYSLIFKNFSYKLIAWDIVWMGFIFFCIASTLWAVNGDLVWHDALIWLCLFLLMIHVRSLDLSLKRATFVHVILASIFVLFLIYSIFLIGIDIELDQNWNHYLGYNVNYSALFLLSLFPFILTIDSKDIRITLLKILSGISLLTVLFSLSSKGCLIIFSFLILFYFRRFVFFLFKIRWVIILTVILILMGLYSAAMLLVFIEEGGDVTHLLGQYDLGRYYMVRKSFLLFLENPLCGVGFGNWLLQSEKYELGSMGYSNAITYEFVTWDEHNLFAKYLAEMGLIGFGLFIAPFIGIFRFCYKQYEDLSALHKGSFLSIMIFLTGLTFYLSAHSKDFHYSGLDILAFGLLGVITNDSERHLSKINGIHINYSLCILSTFCFIGLGNIKYSQRQSQSVIEMIEISPTEGIEKLEIIKNSISFPTTICGKTYSHMLAVEYAKLDKEKRALDCFLNALEKEPYNKELKFNYADYLLVNAIDTSLAKEYLEDIFKRQKTFLSVNIYLAELALLEGDIPKAKSLIDDPLLKKWRWNDFIRLTNILDKSLEY